MTWTPLPIDIQLPCDALVFPPPPFGQARLVDVKAISNSRASRYPPAVSLDGGAVCGKARRRHCKQRPDAVTLPAKPEALPTWRSQTVDVGVSACALRQQQCVS